MALRRPIAFVKAKDTSTHTQHQDARDVIDESRSLYESILATVSEDAEVSLGAPDSVAKAGPATTASSLAMHPHTVARRHQPRRPPTPPTGPQLLSAAQCNEVHVLSQAPVDDLVSTRDGCGWSALMVASAAGAGRAVDFMLGAIPSSRLGDLLGVSDARGLTAESLASLRGHTDVTALLVQARATVCVPQAVHVNDAASDRTISPTASLDDGDGGVTSATVQDDDALSSNTHAPHAGTSTEPTPLAATVHGSTVDDTVPQRWCDKCKVHYTTSARMHAQSISHRLACQPEDTSTPFALTARNKGFQMLVDSGWDARSGLGPTGDGILCPVKTVLKRDRQGIKAPSRRTDNAKPAVTHFGAHDTTAVNNRRGASGTSLGKTTSVDSADPTRGHRKREHVAAAHREKRLRHLLADGPAVDSREVEAASLFDT
eukprot:m.212507 g.212507  ORF g.212507 m.212507 type:complete len:431 (-) comp26141_c0_seq1:96-1388(-)